MKNVSKTTVVIVVVLLAASLAMVEMPVQSVKASSGTYTVHGTDRTETGVPDLGPLPSGVTPDYTFTSLAYMSLTPNPIGVGQTLLINVWTSPGVYHAFYMQSYTIYVEKPDGTEETIGPFDSYMGDATAWIEYVVDQAGTWKFKFESPGTYLPVGEYVDSPTGQAFMSTDIYYLGTSTYYTASSTDWQELTVQEDLVYSYPPAALPTDYWTRPINPTNREWYSIGGNYPWSGAYYYANGRVLYASNYKYTAYVTAAETSHIVWKRQGAIAGLIGGEAYQYSLSAGGGTPAIIYSGRCYQSISKAVGTTSTTYLQCYDLRTGEVYWENEASSSPVYFFGTLYGYTALAPTNIVYELSTSEPVPGAEASRSYSVYLAAISSGRLYKWDPWTGAISLNVSIDPLSSGTIYNNEWVLSLQTTYDENNTAHYNLINWTMGGSTSNFTARIASNITWPSANLGSIDYDAGISVYGWWATPPGPQWCIGYYMQAVDLYTGNVLWEATSNDTTTENMQGAGFILVNRGKVAFGAYGRSWSCWDARTGKKLWTSEKTEYPWGAWWPYNEASYDFNETTSAIITSTYEGVYAINWEDGSIIWHYQDSNAVPFEDPYGETPFFTGVLIADGKIYAYNGEHTASQPLTRDWKLHCINATTGELMWKITNPMVPGAVADGYLVASNTYDGYTYVFGKGKSETTIEAPSTAITLGDSVMLTGTVLDQSPAQLGTPCVSADSMSTWMEYLHLQQPIAGIWGNETVTGISVSLDTVDPNGNCVHIADVVTDGYSGTFGYMWTPDVPGQYTVTATFLGDDSYGSSFAQTYVGVVEAAEATATPEPTETTVDYMPMMYAILVAVVVAIIIGLVALFRKR